MGDVVRFGDIFSIASSNNKSFYVHLNNEGRIKFYKFFYKYNFSTKL